MMHLLLLHQRIVASLLLLLFVPFLTNCQQQQQQQQQEDSLTFSSSSTNLNVPSSCPSDSCKDPSSVKNTTTAEYTVINTTTSSSTSSSSNTTHHHDDHPSVEADSAHDPSCSTFLGGQISNCSTYQISTLHSSPQRCLHIAASASSSSSSSSSSPHDSLKENNKATTNLRTVCMNYANWFDGTNGCKEYGLPQNSNWCDTFGSMYFPTSRYNARQACCVCGGGRKHTLRFDVGDHVRLKKLPASCTSLKVVKVQETLDSTYTLELVKSCGEKTFVRNPWGGVDTRYEYDAGMRILVRGDDPSEMMRHVRVELRKCRLNAVEQEFVLVPGLLVHENRPPMGEPFVIRHKVSGLDLSALLDGSSSSSTLPIYMDAAFPKDLFYKSEEYFYLKVLNGDDDNGSSGHGHSGNNYSLLMSGSFGEPEYSEVMLLPALNDPKLVQDPYSMWTFKEVGGGQGQEPSDREQRGAWVDEHAIWLERMTKKIGIDYLEELAPWHLLDVEREASKNDVKSRFRELSRYFHPDKVQPDKRGIFEKIFILLQNAYDGLKSTDERQKQEFRSSADSDSQLFAHSRYVVELLPFHWSKIGGTDGVNGIDADADVNARYVINATSHLNSINETTLGNGTDVQTPEEHLWVVVLYSARCSMSRTVAGLIDLAAEHLEKFENIKVGAYGCGLYSDASMSNRDLLGVTTDPICKQFQRIETPNVHVVVETLSGNDLTLEENSNFKYFYSSVPFGNTTEFLPHNFIQFAINGKRIWDNLHLVKKMTSSDFTSQEFIDKFAVVAFVDGTKSGGDEETDQEVYDAVVYSLPGLARRFSKADFYIGIAYCGGDNESSEPNDRHVDCSQLDVTWLPDVKMYGANETNGMSLLRGPFGDRRDVQIAMESMSSALSVILGQSSDDLIEDYEELKDTQEDESSESSPGFGQCQESSDAEIALDHTVTEEDSSPKPKLASTNGRQTKKELHYASRKAVHRGNGKILGGVNAGIHGGGAISG